VSWNRTIKSEKENREKVATETLAATEEKRGGKEGRGDVEKAW